MTQQLHCICRKPEIATRTLICCDHCSVWYHPECLQITGRALEQLSLQPQFICKFCVGKGVKNDLFAVEKIMERRMAKNKKKGFEYRIRWQGYRASDDTWEPPSNLKACWKQKLEFDRKMAVKGEPQSHKKRPLSKTVVKTPQKKKTTKTKPPYSSLPALEKALGSPTKPPSPKRKHSCRSSSGKSKKRRPPPLSPIVQADLSTVERNFLQHYGEAAYRELKVQLDAFIEQQQDQNLSAHQLQVFKETYVNIYCEKLDKIKGGISSADDDDGDDNGHAS